MTRSYQPMRRNRSLFRGVSPYQNMLGYLYEWITHCYTVPVMLDVHEQCRIMFSRKRIVP